MIHLRPFRAWRPVPDKAHLVASRSYVSYTEEKMADKLAGNPYSFLHVACVLRNRTYPKIDSFSENETRRMNLKVSVFYQFDHDEFI